MSYEEVVASGEDLRKRIKIDYQHSLGGGAFGDVYAAADETGGLTNLAVKVVDERSLSQKAKAQLRREVALHAELAHPHVLKCHGAYESRSGTLHLVLDRCAGDVGSAIQRGAPVQRLAPRFTAQLLLALQELHTLDIIHCDIKPSNLLLDFDGRLQLCDLGAAARLAAGGGRVTLVGSPAYSAPETVAIAHLGLELGGASYGFAADLWSVGVVLVEMLTGGSLPFPAEPRDAAAQQSNIVFRPPRLEPPAAFTASARSLVLRLLSKQPFLRPTAEEALGESEYLAAHRPAAKGGAQPLEEDEEAAVRACLACLALDDDESSLCASFDAAVLASPPPPPPPDASSPSVSPSSFDDESPGAPSWASSLVEGSP